MAATNPDELDRKIVQARSILGKIPGVLGMGYGHKSRGGQFTRELSLVIFVREKKPLSEVSPAEVIPREVLGIPTDVLRAPRLRKFSCEIIDKFEILKGGILVSNLKRYDATGDLAGDEVGTLGFFGTLNDSSSRDNIALITNRHVIEANGAAVKDPFYQPRFTGTRPFYSLAPADKHPIGEIHSLGMQGNHPYTYPGQGEVEKPYHIDCATAKVATNFSSCCGKNKGIKFANAIHNLNLTPLGSSTVEGIKRLKTEEFLSLPAGQDYKVYKVGKTTGWTTGKVSIPEMSWIDPDDPAVEYKNVIIIADVGPNCGGGAAFAGPGDSGAVVLNQERKVIAHLIGELPGLGGVYVACHIHPTVDFLRVTLISTQNLAGAAGGVTALEASLGLEEHGGDVARAMAFRQEILQSERGRRYHALIQRHTDEVMHLVNRVRPVTVAWHRLHGPDFLGHILHASRHAGHVVPGELHGLSRDAALAHILETLSRHGSLALRSDIEQHSAEVRELFGRIETIEDLAGRCVDNGT